MHEKVDSVLPLWNAWIVLALLSVIIVTASGPDREFYLAEEAISTRVTKMGFTSLEEIELDEGKFEIEAVDAQGSEVEIELDAITGEIIQLEYEHNDDEMDE